MKIVIKLLLVLLVLALVGPTFLKGPDGQALISEAEVSAVPARLRALGTQVEAAVSRLKPDALPGLPQSPGAPESKQYYRWQDAAGVWHFSDEPPADQAAELQAEPLPVLSNRLDTVIGGQEQAPQAGALPEFDSSISPPLPEGVSREELEGLLQGSHERRMGEQL